MSSVPLLMSPPTHDYLDRAYIKSLLSGAASRYARHTLYPPLRAGGRSHPNSAFLPIQVLITLTPPSANVGCAAAGRGIIEEWLACGIPTAASA